MINIQNLDHVFELLEKLSPETPALFGIFRPQHMVEHLTLVLKFSNGKLPQPLYSEPDRAKHIKHYTIHTDREMSRGFKAPMMTDELPELSEKNLASAILKLKQELDDFDIYFKAHPYSKPKNPVMGELDHREWIIFHNKHFTHHFKQFGLV
jgi:hypothetical protein